MPYDLSRKEEADECVGPFSANRIADARAWIGQNGDPQKLRSNEAANTLHISDLYAEFGENVETQRKLKGNGILNDLRTYRAAGVVPARIDERKSAPWTWTNTGGNVGDFSAGYYRIADVVQVHDGVTLVHR